MNKLKILGKSPICVLVIVIGLLYLTGFYINTLTKNEVEWYQPINGVLLIVATAFSFIWFIFCMLE